MNVFGVTPLKSGWKTTYQNLSDLVSENGRYNYRLYGLRLWDLNECITNLNLKSTDTVLEFGAWNTYGAIAVADKVKKLYTTDNFAWADRAYAAKFGTMNSIGCSTPERWSNEFTDYTNIVAEHADIQHLPYKDNMFNKVYSISVIEHVEDDVSALNEIYRVLKPGGAFAFTFEFHPTVSREFSSNTGYYRVYTAQDIIALIDKSNFKLPAEELSDLLINENCKVDGELAAGSITLIK